MISTILALIVATTTAPVATVGDTPRSANHYGKVTATYHADRQLYCMRSGWNSASFQANRRIRAGECRTAADWRTLGLEFTPVAAPTKRAGGRIEIATR